VIGGEIMKLISNVIIDKCVWSIVGQETAVGHFHDGLIRAVASDRLATRPINQSR
jgi:hypothetical protein